MNNRSCQTLKAAVLDKALGENGLPVMARMGSDPGRVYFEELILELRLLFDHLVQEKHICKQLAYALYTLGHLPYVEYSNWQNRGRKFREDLFDPDIFELEAAVESIFCGERIALFNDQ